MVQLPKATLKELRLVNKQWSALAATVLWARVSIDLNETGNRKMGYLINSSFCEVLHNLKDLTITTRSMPPDTLMAREATTNLLRLLGALPRDNLTAFRCPRFSLDPSIVGLLLRTQSHLNALHFCLNEKQSAEVPGTTYVKGNLSTLQAITVRPAGSQLNTYRGFVGWFPHVPVLQRLVIKGISPDSLNDFAGWALPAQAPMLRLRSIDFIDLRLLDSASGMAFLIDVSCLQKLKITDCENLEALLQFLAMRFKHHGSTLKVFSIVLEKFSEAASKACEGLLEAVVSLEHVEVGAFDGSGLPRISSLIGNAQSLRELQLYKALVDSSHSSDELEILATRFQSLQRLGINVGDLRGIIDTLDVLETFDIQTLQDYVRCLVSRPSGWFIDAQATDWCIGHHVPNPEAGHPHPERRSDEHERNCSTTPMALRPSGRPNSRAS